MISFSLIICSCDPSFKRVYCIFLQCKVTLLSFVNNGCFIKYMEIVYITHSLQYFQLTNLFICVYIMNSEVFLGVHMVKICLQYRRPRFKPGSGRSPGGEDGYPLQYSCLENSMDSGAWWAAVHGVMKSCT